jgi:hypothetical protein
MQLKMNTVNTINKWYGRLGNNIQQICCGILYSITNNDQFTSIDHEFIKIINVNDHGYTKIHRNRFYFYTNQVQYKFLPFEFFKKPDFNIDLDFLYNNIREIALAYITPNFKFDIGNALDEDTLVIHIRSGDIFNPNRTAHPDYIPNPLSFYINLINRFKKTIVVTESDDFNPVVTELRKNKKVQIQSTSLANDFSTLLRAKNLASSGVGSFAVAAALCSNNIKKFFCTNLYEIGQLNPEMLVNDKSITIHIEKLVNYLLPGTWTNSKEQRDFILNYPINCTR